MKKLTLFILVIIFISACNKKDDPQPTTNNNGGTTPPTTTNTPPTVSASPSSSTNPTTITISATDADGTISKVEIFNGSTLLTTLTTSPYIYTLPTLANGSYTYTVKAIDNSNAVVSTDVSFAISVSSPKTDTEIILNGFLNRSLEFIEGGDFDGALTITTTSMTSKQNGSSVAQPVGEFFGGAIATSTYTVDVDGYVIMNNIKYSVSTTTNGTVLKLQKLTMGTQYYTFQYNPSTKEATETILSNYLGNALSRVSGGTFTGTLTIGSDGSFITSGTQPTGGFFETTVASGATKTYTVDNDGYLVVALSSPYNTTCSYSVSLDANNMLKLTKRFGNTNYTIFQ